MLFVGGGFLGLLRVSGQSGLPGEKKKAKKINTEPYHLGCWGFSVILGVLGRLGLLGEEKEGRRFF